jgi:hypothetical protein
MCYFLTVAVRPADAILLEPFREAGFQIKPSLNPVLSAAVGRGVAAFYVSTAMCACDLYSFVHGRHDAERERLRSKCARKGWTAAKIERALRDHDRARGHSARVTAKGRLRERFVEAFCRTAASADEAFLFGHWYRGHVDAEDFPPPRRVPLSLEEYEARGGVFPEDEMVVVDGGK